MPTRSWPTSNAADPCTPSSAFESLPAHLERKIAARWKEWEPWAIIHLRQRHDVAAASTELTRLRQRHRRHVLSLLEAGIEMRLIRRHRLDDPRITEEARGLFVQAALERRRKASLARRRDGVPYGADRKTAHHG